MYKIFYSWLFYFMLAHFGLLIYLLWANIKHLWQEIKKIDKKIWLILLIIFLFGFYLRNSEYWLGLTTDGYVYQTSAQLWLLHGNYVKSCALGNQIDCRLFEQVLAPPGYPFIIALVHLIFGIHSLNASVISAILSSLTILLAFLIAYLLWGREEIGLYSALIFSLIPLNILYSQTGEARPTGLFFVGLTVLFYLLALKNNKFITWLLTIVSLSYAIYVRQESYILLPLLFIFFTILKWKDIKIFFVNIIKKKEENLKLIFKIIFLFLVFLGLQIPVLKWLLINNPFSTYPGGGFFTLHYKVFKIHSELIFRQLFNQSPMEPIFHYNIIISAIFLIAALFLIISRKKNHLFIVCLFLAYFVLYSFLLFNGNLDAAHQRITGDYIRRTVMLHLPYAVIAGYGVYLLNPIKKRKFLLLALIPLWFSIFIVRPPFVFDFMRQSRWYQSYFYKTENYSFYFPKSIFKDSRATKKGVSTNSYFAAIEKTPNDCLIIAGMYFPAISDYFENNRRKIASIDLINPDTKDLFLDEFKKNKCLIYFGDYRCGPDFKSSDDYSCQFLDEHLNKTFLFREKTMEIYKVELK